MVQLVQYSRRALKIRKLPIHIMACLQRSHLVPTGRGLSKKTWSLFGVFFGVGVRTPPRFKCTTASGSMQYSETQKARLTIYGDIKKPQVSRGIILEV